MLLKFESDIEAVEPQLGDLLMQAKREVVRYAKPRVMDGPLLDFFRAARSAGLRISPAESIDAVQAVRSSVSAGAAGCATRSAWCLPRRRKRSAPSPIASTCSSPGTLPRRAQPEPEPRWRQLAGQSAGERDGQRRRRRRLARMLLDGDQAGLAAARTGRRRGPASPTSPLFTQVNLYTRRILERWDSGAGTEIAAGRTAAAGRLRQGRDWLRDQVKRLRPTEPAALCRGRERAIPRTRASRTRIRHRPARP